MTFIHAKRKSLKYLRYTFIKKGLTALHNKTFIMVPGAGLEPARPNEHMPLKHACLPISAPGRKISECKNRPIYLIIAK
jgi:hypothetical protein